MLPSGRRFPPQHPLLRNLQQVVTILSQQIKRMGNVRDVLNVTMLKA
jgi:hypothetical protein